MEIGFNVVEPLQICVTTLIYFCFSQFAQSPPTQISFPFLERWNLLLYLFYVHDDIWTTSTFTSTFSENQQLPNLKEHVVQTVQNTICLFMVAGTESFFFYDWRIRSLELKDNHIKSRTLIQAK